MPQVGRALAASRMAPPDVPLALDTVLATLQIPIKWLTRKLADREEQKLVERIYDELKATGTVEASLPEDDRTVRVMSNVVECDPSTVRADDVVVLAWEPLPDGRNLPVFRPAP